MCGPHGDCAGHSEDTKNQNRRPMGHVLMTEGEAKYMAGISESINVGKKKCEFV